MVKTLAELPQIIHEAFYLASSGRPGPVLVDIPKDVFQAQGHYTPVDKIHLRGYRVTTEGHTGQIRRAAQMIWEAERPMVYAGGGVIAGGAESELRELVERVDTPAVCTLMGLGAIAERTLQLHQHARHAWKLRGEYGFDRVRSADRAGGALR